jgi:EmrB/QacA subfamily drug resistance transporter
MHGIVASVTLKMVRALILLCLAQFVAVLDGTVVLVALPEIGRDLELSGGALQWVVTAYVLAFAGCLLVAGRLADALGRRRIFCAGLALFTAASLACGLAPAAAALLAARAVQGLGAALAGPAALAMIVNAFPDGRPRERAVAAWTGVAAIGGAAGLVLGGVIADALGWRWIFLVNVPAGAIALAFAPRVLPAHRGHGVAGGLDLPGAAAATGGLGLLVLALAQAEQSGPLEPLTLAALGAAAVLLVAFAIRERAAANPLVPPALIAVRPLAAAMLAGALLTATTSGGAVLASLHLQDVVRLRPAAAGLVLLPFSLCAAVGSAVSSRLPGRPGAIIAGGVALVGAGSAVAAAGLALTSAIAILVAWGVLCGLGIGIASVAATTLGASAVTDVDRGTAAGLLNTAAQVGTALGIAVLVLIAGSTGPTAGHRLAFAVAGVLAVAGAAALLAALHADPRRDSASGNLARDAQSVR